MAWIDKTAACSTPRVLFESDSRFEALLVEGLAEKFIHEVVNVPPVEGGRAVLGGRKTACRGNRRRHAPSLGMHRKIVLK